MDKDEEGAPSPIGPSQPSVIPVAHDRDHQQAHPQRSAVNWCRSFGPWNPTNLPPSRGNRQGGIDIPVRKGSAKVAKICARSLIPPLPRNAHRPTRKISASRRLSSEGPPPKSVSSLSGGSPSFKSTVEPERPEPLANVLRTPWTMAARRALPSRCVFFGGPWQTSWPPEHTLEGSLAIRSRHKRAAFRPQIEAQARLRSCVKSFCVRCRLAGLFSWMGRCRLKCHDGFGLHSGRPLAPRSGPKVATSRQLGSAGFVLKKIL